jgi:hypothetical protein
VPIRHRRQEPADDRETIGEQRMLATISSGDLPFGQQELENFLFPHFEKRLRRPLSGLGR